MDIRAWASNAPPKLGTILTIDHPAIVEIARLAGFDWLWIDAEHGSYNEISASIACAVASGGPPTLVRLPDRSATAIKRFLDTGCDGIILPQVSTVAEVNEIARAALYPPRGERSIGLARAQGYGATLSDYFSNKSYSIIVQIETVTGVANARAIVEHEAVDAVIIGPYDLSGSFGIPGQIESPLVTDAIASVLEICKSAGKPCGIFSATAEKARSYLGMAFDLIAIGIDTSTLLRAYTALRNSLPNP